MPYDPIDPRFPPALSPLLIASLERVEDRGREAMAIDADSPERLDEIAATCPAWSRGQARSTSFPSLRLATATNIRAS